MTVTTLNHTLHITGVTKLVITEAVDSGQNTYVREIRVFVGDENPAVGTFRVEGDTAAAIEVTTPALQF